MQQSQILDGGDGIQVRGTIANILKKQWLTAKDGWSSTLRLGAWLAGF
jgi:hypothetical protein